MTYRIRRADYFYASISDPHDAACSALGELASQGVNLLAFTAVPMGPTRTQLTIFPEEARRMQAAAGQAGLQLDGPHPAILVTGDDQLGAFAQVHARLAAADVEVFASNGLAVGDNYGYVVYVRPGDIDRAMAALE